MKNPEFKEDINIRDFARIINNRKNVILGIFCVILISAVISIALLPKNYEVKATIQNGRVDEPIINYGEAATLIKSGYFLEPIFKKAGMNILQEQQIKRIIFVENIKDSNFFILKVRLDNNDLGDLLIQEIIKAYLENGNAIYNKQIELVKTHIGMIENLIEKTKQSMDRNASSKKENILQLEFPDDKVQLKDLLSQKFQLENKLLLAREFRLLNRPVKPQYPASPKKAAIIIIACFTGVIAGIFCALLLESWENTRPDDGEKS